MQSELLDAERRLPTSEELPCSDDTPVDNENQNTLPNWLLAMLEEIWSERQDWFFGVDMGIYDREGQKKGAPLVVPDGFLSVGVQRHKREGRGRLSYVLQEEHEIAPILALEMISKTYNQEYEDKMTKYARLGVKYYVIYNPEYSRRDRHEPFEVYRLVGGRYQLERAEPFWIEEIGLGIGRVQGRASGIIREWLAWHDSTGSPYPLTEQLIRQERQYAQEQYQRAQQQQQRAEQEHQRAQQQQQRAEQEHQRAEQEHQRAAEMERVLDQERQRAAEMERLLDEEKQRSEQERLEKLRLLEQLRQLGVDLDQL